MAGPAIAFLHTAQAHVAAFTALVGELAPAVRTHHVVREDLLALARKIGAHHPDVVASTTSAMHETSRTGASVVVCTCSTVGGAAEATGSQGKFTAMRIDRAMADEAVRQGGPVLLVAALGSTLGSTELLLRSSAHRAGTGVDIRSMVAQDAWTMFEEGRSLDYFDAIARVVRSQLPGPRVVVLAQASMQGAVQLLAGAGVPVLASPRLGVEAALKALSAAGGSPPRWGATRAGGESCS
jgi:hypothetical protein